MQGLIFKLCDQVTVICPQGLHLRISGLDPYGLHSMRGSFLGILRRSRRNNTSIWAWCAGLDLTIDQLMGIIVVFLAHKEITTIGGGQISVNALRCRGLVPVDMWGGGVSVTPCGVTLINKNMGNHLVTVLPPIPVLGGLGRDTHQAELGEESKRPLNGRQGEVQPLREHLVTHKDKALMNTLVLKEFKKDPFEAG